MSVYAILPVAAFLVVNAANAQVPDADPELLDLEPCLSGAVSASVTSLWA
jgi:hypothetical protein